MVNIFSTRIKDLRLSQGFSLSEMASKIGVTKSAVAQYENGQSQPNMRTLSTISITFEVSIDYLIGSTDNPKINR